MSTIEQIGAVDADKLQQSVTQLGAAVEENPNPIGRAYYAFSTLLCTPAPLAQEVGLASCGQAGVDGL